MRLYYAGVVAYYIMFLEMISTDLLSEILSSRFNQVLSLDLNIKFGLHTDKETPNLSTFCRFWAPYEVKFGGTGQLPLLNKISSKLVQFYHCSVFLSFQGSIFKFYFITKHSFDV